MSQPPTTKTTGEETTSHDRRIFVVRLTEWRVDWSSYYYSTFACISCQLSETVRRCHGDAPGHISLSSVIYTQPCMCEVNERAVVTSLGLLYRTGGLIGIYTPSSVDDARVSTVFDLRSDRCNRSIEFLRYRDEYGAQIDDPIYVPAFDHREDQSSNGHPRSKVCGRAISDGGSKTFRIKVVACRHATRGLDE